MQVYNYIARYNNVYSYTYTQDNHNCTDGLDNDICYEDDLVTSQELLNEDSDDDSDSAIFNEDVCILIAL